MRVNRAPLWGRDSATLAIEAYNPGDPTTLLIAEGGKVRDLGLTSPDLVIPSSWTTGKQLLVRINRPETLGDVVLINPETGAIEELFGASENVGDVTISPDGRWIAYQEEAGELPTLVVRPSDGSQRTWSLADGRYPFGSRATMAASSSSFATTR